MWHDDSHKTMLWRNYYYYYLVCSSRVWGSCCLLVNTHHWWPLSHPPPSSPSSFRTRLGEFWPPRYISPLENKSQKKQSKNWVQNSNGCKYSVVVLEHLQQCSYGDLNFWTLERLDLRRLFFFSLIRIWTVYMNSPPPKGHSQIKGAIRSTTIKKKAQEPKLPKGKQVIKQLKYLAKQHWWVLF